MKWPNIIGQMALSYPFLLFLFLFSFSFLFSFFPFVFLSLSPSFSAPSAQRLPLGRSHPSPQVPLSCNSSLSLLSFSLSFPPLTTIIGWAISSHHTATRAMVNRDFKWQYLAGSTSSSTNLGNFWNPWSKTFPWAPILRCESCRIFGVFLYAPPFSGHFPVK